MILGISQSFYTLHGRKEILRINKNWKTCSVTSSFLATNVINRKFKIQQKASDVGVRYHIRSKKYILQHQRMLIILTRTVDLFERKIAGSGNQDLRTILVVGRPGMGKTLLTKQKKILSIENIVCNEILFC